MGKVHDYMTTTTASLMSTQNKQTKKELKSGVYVLSEPRMYVGIRIPLTELVAN